MKIAIAGKGGTGKTTLAGTMARLFARRGFKVLALDNDSSPNLALALGIPLEDAKKIIPLAQQKEFAKERTGVSPSQSWGAVFKINPKVDDVVDRFGVYAPDNVRLLILGAIEQGGRGCFCPENALLKALLHHVLIGRDEMVIIDLEAGVEHLGRASSRGVDVMLVMVEPGIRSVRSAEQIMKLAQDIGITNIYAVLNKIRSPEDAQALRRLLSVPGIQVIGEMPHDKALIQADLAGKAPLDYDPTAASIHAITQICDAIQRAMPEMGPPLPEAPALPGEPDQAKTVRHERSAGFIVYRTDGPQRLYLLLKHNEHGHWDFPKGLIEPGEDEQAAALRELSEETGIPPETIRIQKGFKGKISYYYSFKEERISKTVTLFLAETTYPRQSVRVSFEHSAAEWFLLTEALSKATYENTRRVLQQAEDHLQANRLA